MSASQSSGSVACLEVPLRNPLEDDSVTPLVKWSTSMSTSLLRADGGDENTPSEAAAAHSGVPTTIRLRAASCTCKPTNKQQQNNQVFGLILIKNSLSFAVVMQEEHGQMVVV